jgi:hypothetical protein
MTFTQSRLLPLISLAWSWILAAILWVMLFCSTDNSPDDQIEGVRIGRGMLHPCAALDHFPTPLRIVSFLIVLALYLVQSFTCVVFTALQNERLESPRVFLSILRAATPRLWWRVKSYHLPAGGNTGGWFGALEKRFGSVLRLKGAKARVYTYTANGQFPVQSWTDASTIRRHRNVFSSFSLRKKPDLDLGDPTTEKLLDEDRSLHWSLSSLAIVRCSKTKTFSSPEAEADYRQAYARFCELPRRDTGAVEAEGLGLMAPVAALPVDRKSTQLVSYRSRDAGFASVALVGTEIYTGDADVSERLSALLAASKEPINSPSHAVSFTAPDSAVGQLLPQSGLQHRNVNGKKNDGTVGTGGKQLGTDSQPKSSTGSIRRIGGTSSNLSLSLPIPLLKISLKWYYAAIALLLSPVYQTVILLFIPYIEVEVRKMIGSNFSASGAAERSVNY